MKPYLGFNLWEPWNSLVWHSVAFWEGVVEMLLCNSLPLYSPSFHTQMHTTKKTPSWSSILGKHSIQVGSLYHRTFKHLNTLMCIFKPLKRISMEKGFFPPHSFAPVNLFKISQDLPQEFYNVEVRKSCPVHSLHMPPPQEGLLWPSGWSQPSLPCAIILFDFLCNTYHHLMSCLLFVHHLSVAFSFRIVDPGKLAF